MRTVKVDLDADVNGFLLGIKEADKATTKLDHDIEALDRDINKLPADAAKAGAALAVMGAEAKKTGANVDDLGKKTESTGKKTEESSKNITAMRSRMDELETSLKKVGQEFARTGDPALLKKFRSGSSELSGLKSMVKGLEELGVHVEQFGLQAEKAGTSAGKLFSGGLTSPVALGGAAAVAPTALAAVGGLAAVGAGAGVAGLGVVGAAMGDPAEFSRRWGAVTTDLKAKFLDATSVFHGPALAAIDSIGAEIKRWDLRSLFASAVPYVAPLVRGAEGFADHIVAGVQTLVADAGPAIAVFSQDLPRIGSAIQDALANIGSEAKGGAVGLHSLDMALVDIITITGGVVTGAEAITGAVHDAAISTRDFFDGVPVWAQVAFPPLALYKKLFDEAVGHSGDQVSHMTQTQKGAEDAARAAGDAFSAEGDDLTKLAQKLAAADQTVDKFVGGQVSNALNTMMSLDRATLGFNQSLTQLTASFKANGKSLDEHTAKGQANVSAVLDSVSANIQSYQANIAAGMSAEQAASAYDDNTHALERNLRKAGLTQSAIDGLIGKYRGVPTKVDTDIVLHGLETAIRNLDATLRLINGIHDKNATVSVTTVYHTQGSPPVGQGGTRLYKPGYAYAHGSIRRAADGLLVPPTDPGSVLFGEPETGGEAFIPLRGISQMRAMSLASAVGDAYGFGVTPWAGGRMGHAGSSAVAVAVSVVAAPGSDSAVGTLVNKLIRDGLVVVKASQVRTGV